MRRLTEAEKDEFDQKFEKIIREVLEHCKVCPGKDGQHLTVCIPIRKVDKIKADICLRRLGYHDTSWIYLTPKGKFVLSNRIRGGFPLEMSDIWDILKTGMPVTIEAIMGLTDLDYGTLWVILFEFKKNGWITNFNVCYDEILPPKGTVQEGHWAGTPMVMTFQEDE